MIVLMLAAEAVQSASPCVEAGNCSVELTAAQLFELAQLFERDNALGDAENIYRALAENPDVEIRSEARFRHGQLLARQSKLAEAAVLYRAILDEKPDAQAVRIELAAVLSLIGDIPAARRQLRQAQAGGLPPEVARIADQFAASLRSQKPFGASIEVSMAPTTNINRATNASMLETIIADMELSEEARATSGIGLRIGGQFSGRIPLMQSLNLTGRFATQSSLYRDSSFNDLSGAGHVGLEIQLGDWRLRPELGRTYRWYGKVPYATTDAASLYVQRPLGTRAQVEASVAVGEADYKWNDLQDGPVYNASLTYERAFSARMGASIGLMFDRQDARDPGYATTSGGGQLLLWREMGKISLYGIAGASRLEADERLGLFRDRRKDWQYRVVAGATLRQFTVAGFAPIVRASYERNKSTVGIYDYRRLGGEIGITRAF